MKPTKEQIEAAIERVKKRIFEHKIQLRKYNLTFEHEEEYKTELFALTYLNLSMGDVSGAASWLGAVEVEYTAETRGAMARAEDTFKAMQNQLLKETEEALK